MSKIKEKREELNITQEQLAEKCGVSTRTIQRIEAGAEPKGHTLNALTKALGLEVSDLKESPSVMVHSDHTWLKIINFSSLPLSVLPPMNIVVPLIIMFAKKEVNRMNKQVVTLQIFWTIGAFILFMLASFMKNWFDLGNKLILVTMIVLVLSNVFVILRNSFEIDRRGKLYVDLNFSII